MTLLSRESEHQVIERHLQGGPTTTRVTSASWLLAAVVPDELGISWNLDADSHPIVVTPVPNLMQQFVRLRSDPEVARFAVKWGPLFPNHAACRSPYPPFRRDHDHDPVNPECRSLGAVLGVGWEPYAIWHRYIAKIRTLAEVAAALADPHRDPAEDILHTFVRQQTHQWPKRRDEWVRQALLWKSTT